MKTVLPAGFYIFGDVKGVAGAVGVPALAGVYYSECFEYELDIANGASCNYDETDVGLLGLAPINNPDDYDYYNVLEMTEPFEVVATENSFSAGPVSFVVPETFLTPPSDSE